MKPSEPILLVAAFGAGLATGLAHFQAPLVATAVVLAWLVWHRAEGLVPLLVAATLLGGLEASLAWRLERDTCASALPAARIRLRVRLADPVDREGGLVDVTPLAACSGTVTARWPPGSAAAAGTTAQVVARWVPRPRTFGRSGGMLLVGSAQVETSAPGVGERVRTWVAATAGELYGSRAGLVEALVTGRRVGMDRALQDRFAQSGLVHLLSISGFHVGLVAAWVALAARACRVRREHALGLAAGVAALYVAFLGWPPPATRAAALAALAAWCRVRQRNVRPDPLLAVTCLAVLLVDPWAVGDLGAWLSAAALWGATTATRWSDGALGRAWGWRALASSVGATAATAPITAAALGAVAPVGIALNFAAIPLAAVAVPGVFASLLAAPLAGPVARALAGGAGLGLHGLELLAGAGAAIPGGHVICEASPAAALPWIALLAVLLWGIHARTTPAEAFRRWAWAGAVALWLPLATHWGHRLGSGPSGLSLHFLDVGQGDGAVLRTPHGRYVMIDAGPLAGGDDAGRRVLVPYLAREGVTDVAALIVSHAHADHVGGAVAVLDRFRTELVIEPGRTYADPVYYRFLDAVSADGVPWHRARPGERFTLDSVHFTLLHPDPAWPGWGDDLNEDSVVLLVEYGAFRAMFMGDAGLPAEHWLRGRVGRVDLLKVGHHGSRGASGDEWLDELRPSAAVISVGRRNTYGHPSPDALARLARHGAALWRTDRDGDVVVTSDGRSMRVAARGGTKIFDVVGRAEGAPRPTPNSGANP
jgi:competence protein ComEC